MPAFWSLFKRGSLRTGPQPSVQLCRYRREKLPLVHSISRMITIGAAPGVSWRPDLDCRHSLADGVYDLLGNTLGLFRAGASLFESGVEIRKRLVFRGWRLASGRWRTRAGLPLTLFRRCHLVMVAEAWGTENKNCDGPAGPAYSACSYSGCITYFDQSRNSSRQTLISGFFMFRTIGPRKSGTPLSLLDRAARDSPPHAQRIRDSRACSLVSFVPASISCAPQRRRSASVSCSPSTLLLPKVSCL